MLDGTVGEWDEDAIDEVVVADAPGRGMLDMVMAAEVGLY